MYIINVPLNQKPFQAQETPVALTQLQRCCHPQTRMFPFIFQTLYGQGELYDSSVMFVWEPKKTKKAVAGRLVKHKMMKMPRRSHFLGCFSMALGSNCNTGCSARDKTQYNSKIPNQ